MSSDLEHWQIDAKVYDDRVEETHLISDPTRNIRRKPSIKVWHVERYLGRGSFGEVRLERNRDENRDNVRAVKKVILIGSTLSPKECEQELKALLEFSKPKWKDAAIFVEFFGWFRNDLNMYLAMEYIKLGDLETNVRLHSGRLSEIEAQSIAKQVLSGLEIMHRLSFAHRDLKPQNILVVAGPPDWWVKLADFGLSKRLTNSTEYRTLAGTPSYMAPEMLGYQISSREYTSSVDLWAVGCIIYRIIAGIVPFPPGTSLAQYYKDESLFPNDLLINYGITDSGSMFVRQLLAIDPEERLSAAEALQHRWIISPISITPNISPASVERVESSGSTFSAIKYDTASHPGLKSYSSSTSSSTSKLSSPKTDFLEPITSKDLKREQDSVLKKEALANLDSKYQLAHRHYDQKRYQEAEVVFREVVRGREKVLGREHLETLDSKYWLARALYGQRQYQEAEVVFREVVRGREKVLGREHLKTLDSKYWLAHALYQPKQYQEAEVVFREVVRGREKLLGREHLETLDSEYWLAHALYGQRQYQEAEVVFREVVRGREKVLGREHLETLDSKYWLARALYGQRQYQEAEVVFREVVRGREKVLGREHLKTLDSKYWLAHALYQPKQYQEAEVVFREVVRGREKLLGREHLETLDSEYWLAHALYQPKQYQEAEVVFREVVRGREKVLGQEDLKTLDSKYWLAHALYGQRQYQEAEVVFREVVRGREKVLGKEAPDTVESRRRLEEVATILSHAK